MTDIITVKDLNKSYASGSWAVKDLNLSVYQGELLAIVGPSGCGKSTLLKLIVGIETASSGEIIKPENISMVFQTGALIPWLNALDNVAFGLKMKEMNEVKAREEALGFLELVNLKKLADKYPRELSGGQRQRVGTARAFAVSPSVLLMDEPFSALDTLTTDDIHQDLLSIWEQTQTTIVLVSHSLDEALLLGDRIMIMSQGEVKKIINVDLDRPRIETRMKFLETQSNLKKEFRDLVVS